MTSEKTCASCGGPLDPGRVRYCKRCRPDVAGCDQPPVPFPTLPEQRSGPEYTIAERRAQADALGLHYGDLMAHLENNWTLPEMVRPIQWPKGSPHSRETKVYYVTPDEAAPDEPAEGILPPVPPNPSKRRKTTTGVSTTLTHCLICGTWANKKAMNAILIKPGGKPDANPKVFGHCCPGCWDSWGDTVGSARELAIDRKIRGYVG